jgi:hypothetical protein
MAREFEEAATDQQPIGRTVGRRRSRVGMLPDAPTRNAMTAMAQYRTRAPKGVFYYDSHEQMQADRDRWTVDAVVVRNQSR